LKLLFLSPFLGSVFLALTATTVLGAEDVLDIRTGQHPDKTRLVISLSDEISYDILPRTNAGPLDLRTIALDLNDTTATNDIMSVVHSLEQEGVFEGITLAISPGSVRLVIALNVDAGVDNIFLLTPQEGFAYRLVVDVKPLTAQQVAELMPLPQPDPPVAQPSEAETVETASIDSSQLSPDPSQISNLSEDPGTPMPKFPSEPTFEDYYDDYAEDESNLNLSGYFEVEGRLFTQSSAMATPKDYTVSFALEPLIEYYDETLNTEFRFKPFARVDLQDKDRSHVDIRELNATMSWEYVLLRVGIDSVFWGVTESNHLVDIINQDDSLEDIDQEDKLGQPMISLEVDTGFGVISGYVMSFFRERRFPGPNGRLRLPLVIDYSQTQFESGSKNRHVDWAVRWSHVLGNFDIGLSHFRGTNREPEFLLGLDRDGNRVLIPRYNLISQTGLDVQATFEDLLFKFEAIRRRGSGSGAGSDFLAMTGGVEYTLYGLAGGASDIGLLAEYLYDDRDVAQATTPFESDLFVGMRWAANDIDGTEVLLGGIFDLDTSAKFINFEGSRRIGDDWKVTLDARFFLGVPMTDPIFPLSRDDFLQVRLARYF